MKPILKPNHIPAKGRDDDDMLYAGLSRPLNSRTELARCIGIERQGHRQQSASSGAVHRFSWTGKPAATGLADVDGASRERFGRIEIPGGMRTYRG